jgi:hypothetical protein
MTDMSDEEIPHKVVEAIDELGMGRRNSHGDIYQVLMREINHPVGWANKAWPPLADYLTHKDNRVRAIAGQALCNLSQSVLPDLIRRDLPALAKLTYDERFVTARHVLQNLWKVGVMDVQIRSDLLAILTKRFSSCAEENSVGIVRKDILKAMHTLFGITGDSRVQDAAEALILSEPDKMLSKAYHRAWQGM